MDCYVSTTDWLVETVIINYSLAIVVLRPDSNPECVTVYRVSIFGPDHELVNPMITGRAIKECARACELGVRGTLIDYEPLVFVAVEVQVTDSEVKLYVAGRNFRTHLIFRNEAKIGFTLGLCAAIVCPASASFGPDPTTAGDKTARRIVK